jgi:hypothetical protein
MIRDAFRSIGAVIAGFVLVAVLAVATDTALQSVGILPVTGATKFESGHSALALSYHLAYVVLGGYVAARLAPHHGVAHALALGALGMVFSAFGLVAIVKGDLAPAWYGWALIFLSVPVTCLGGKLFELQRKGQR